MHWLSAGNFWTYDCIKLISIWKNKWNQGDGTHEKNNIWTSSAAGRGHCFSFFFWYTLSSPGLRWMRSGLLLVRLVEAWICSALWFRPGCVTSSSYKWRVDKGVPVCSDRTPSWNVISIHHRVSLVRRPPRGTREWPIIDVFVVEKEMFVLCVCQCKGMLLIKALYYVVLRLIKAIALYTVTVHGK